MNIGHEVGVTAQSQSMIGHVIPTENNVRMIPKLDGVSKHYKFAKTIIGNGTGKITLRGKLSDIGSTVKLLDGDGLANRLYLNLNDSTDVLSAGTLTVTVNEIDNTAIYNEVTEIVITGDFTGLELATLFARFNGTECAKFQPFFMSYADASQSFEYDFTKAPAEFFLPEDFEFERNQVTANQVAVWDGTEASYDSKSLGIGSSVAPGKTFHYTVKIRNHVQGRIKLNGEIEDTAWFGADGTYSGVLTPGAFISSQSASEPLEATVEIDIREVPNALLLQGASADINDDFEPMTQRPDGHWVGTENHFNLSMESSTWTESPSGVFTKNAASWGGMGESQFDGAFLSAQDVEVSANISGEDLDLYTRNAENTGNTNISLPDGPLVMDYYIPTAGLWFDSDNAVGQSVSKIKMKRLVKLSDYLIKQYQIEQTEAAISAYQAKNKTRNITTLDGVDDRVSLGAFPAPVGPIIRQKIKTQTSNTSKVMALFGSATDINNEHRAVVLNYSAEGSIKLYSSGQTPGESTGDLVGEVVNEIELVQNIITGHSELYLNGDFVYSATDNAPTHLQKETVKWVGGVATISTNGGGSSSFEGKLFDYSYIDEGAPLPIDQGGNSGFWSLDDSKGTIAANKLGLDKKGNIVVKDSAGLGDESVIDFSAVTLTAPYASIVDGKIVIDTTSATSSGNYIRWVGNPLDPAKEYYATYTVDIADGGLRLNKQSDGVANDVYSSQVGLRYVHLGPGGNGNVEFYIEKNVKAVISNLDIKEAYGYGEWRGLPSDFSSTDEYSRDSDGTQYSSNLFTDEVAANPYNVHEAWTYLGNHRWQLNGNGEAQGLQPISIDGLPGLSELVFKIESISGGTMRCVNASGTIYSETGTYTEVIDVADKNGLVFKRSAGTVTMIIELISCRSLLPLSPELQRQWDLAIVEKQIEKLLTKNAKTMVLAELDGVNDFPSATEKTLEGDFDLMFWVQSSDLSSDAALNDSTKFAALGEEGYSLIYIDNPDGLEFLIGDSNSGFSRHIFGGQSNILNGLLNEVTISKRGLELSAWLNESEQIGSTITIEDVPITIECNFFGGAGRYLAGHTGPILIKDYADPKNSRFYVHNAAGYLEDRLHPDGSMDGTYNGMPVDFSNIETFKKKGDDWHSPNLTAHTPDTINPPWVELPDGTFYNDGTGGSPKALFYGGIIELGCSYYSKIVAHEVESGGVRTENTDTDFEYLTSVGSKVFEWEATTNVNFNIQSNTSFVGRVSHTLHKIIKGA